MQDLENNMDELFRKAAGNYTPKKGESNWDKIVRELLNKSIIPDAKIKENNTIKYAGLTLLLLLFLFAGAIFITYTYNKNNVAAVYKLPEKTV